MPASSIPSSVQPVASVPVDAYDMPPYEDETVPYGDGVAVYEQPSHPVQPRQTAAPAVRQIAPVSPTSPAPISEASSNCDASTSSGSESTGSAQSPEEIEAILTIGFGEGIVFEEVKE